MHNINLTNIQNFISGNLRYYLSKIIDMPIHLKEQYYFRLYTCKDDCLIKGKCIKCNCPVLKKALVEDSCNPDRFPKLMGGLDWKKYKEENNINNIQEIINIVENDLLKRRL